VSSVDPSQPPPADAPSRSHLTSIPVDPLASHIASMIRTLDDEVRRLRDEATAETTRVLEEARASAERIVTDARAKRDRIIEEANRQAAESEARRDAMLEERTAIIAELSTIRDTIVSLAGRFEQERPDLTPAPKATSSAQLPPPPRRRRVDENQQALFAEGEIGDPPPG
jgi:cell division septum initiation protein DivIVA